MVVATAFMVIPKMMEPLSHVAMMIGRLLKRFLASTSLGILFCLVLVPIGLGMRLFRRDPLKLNWDNNAVSYWVRRDPPGPLQSSLTDPF